MNAYDGEARCPACGCVNEATTQVAGDDTGAPRAGDCLICAECATVCVATGVGNATRLPTEAERAVLLANDLVQQAVGVMLLLKALDV